MALKHVKHIVQTPTDAVDYIGQEGEIIIEGENFSVRVHDGETPGGFVTLTQAIADALYLSVSEWDTARAEIEADIAAGDAAVTTAILAKIIVEHAPVISLIDTAPGSPAAGARYLIKHSGLAGILVGHADQILEYDASIVPRFSGVVPDGSAVFSQADQNRYFYHSGSGTWDNDDVALTDFATDINNAINAAQAAAETHADNGDTATLAAALAAGTGDPFENSTGFADGYQKLPSLVIFQWGSYSGAADPTITFPIPFVVVCRSVVITGKGDGAQVSIGTINETEFTAFTDGSDFCWFAVGR